MFVSHLWQFRFLILICRRLILHLLKIVSMLASSRVFVLYLYFKMEACTSIIQHTESLEHADTPSYFPLEQFWMGMWNSFVI